MHGRKRERPAQYSAARCFHRPGEKRRKFARGLPPGVGAGIEIAGQPQIPARTDLARQFGEHFPARHVIAE